MLNVALAKGRLADSCADIFLKCGIRAEILKEETRKLVLETPDKKFRFFFVKPADVPTYVEYGIADIGIVGKDTLLEAGADLYEMLDLKFEKCRLCLAGFPEKKAALSSPHLRVATKYVNTAKKLFFSRGEDVEIIKLNGSIELAPLTGLADVIFDIVQSGGTLRANGLVVLEEVFDISARLVANKVSLKTKAAEVLPLIAEMKKYIQE
ncbi:MAG TPA: ATP phosphoribosyltransferase [Candidatus Borkfalkia excrementipullorum]|nr:ATP phosphoribosyltransferase [Candidatus Borkfalkia excrementipullorum]